MAGSKKLISGEKGNVRDIWTFELPIIDLRKTSMIKK